MWPGCTAGASSPLGAHYEEAGRSAGLNGVWRAVKTLAAYAGLLWLYVTML
jgi:hypothetical protein